jgi:hypothetical protein
LLIDPLVLASGLHDEQGLVGPAAGSLEGGPGVAIHKDIIEHMVIHGWAFAVTHVEPGTQEHPLSIFRR